MQKRFRGNNIGGDYVKSYVLMTYYIKYLKEIRKVSDSTVNHYKDALKYISKYLVKKGMVSESVYEIQDIGELKIIRAYLYSDSDFIALDKRGHQMYSASLNNYYKFAEGEGFSNIYRQIEVMDTEIPVSKKIEKKVKNWGRSSIIKLQSIEAAGFQCEMNMEHKTFTAKSTGESYMEGHHAIPMKAQEKFQCSLDVYANIVCLCPICHRLLHYGVETEKEAVLNKIYYDRSERLAKSGIKVSRNDFEMFAM
jgi:5-methylcytosine-specific restriction protein A